MPKTDEGGEQTSSMKSPTPINSVAISKAFSASQARNVAVRVESAHAVSAHEADENSWQAIDSNVVSSLKRELVGVGKLDGQPITDVQLRSRCQTAFITGQTSTIVQWEDVGNFAAKEAGGIVTIPINDRNGRHSFTVPDGVPSRRVDGSLGLLADECQHGQ